MPRNRTPNPLLVTYLKRYQENPNSRVFAPLAESYRKAGLPEEAVEIAREGLKQHPTFVGGKVALARALFDLDRFEEAIELMKPVIDEVPDNLVAQRLVAESALMLGRPVEALSSYKMLLFYNPTDSELAQIVRELESRAYEQGALVLQTEMNPVSRSVVPADFDDPLGGFDVRPAVTAIQDDPDEKRRVWMAQIEILQGLMLNLQKNRTVDTSN